MQTYITSFPDIERTGSVLDFKRHNNQINEGFIVLRTLTGWYKAHGGKGWPYHSVTKAWEGHEGFLYNYMFSLLMQVKVKEPKKWIARYYKFEELREWMEERGFMKNTEPPHWLNERMCSVYRAQLLLEYPEYYAKFGWTETPARPEKWDARMFSGII